MRRFFILGDGKLRIRSTKNKLRFAGRYRSRSGVYRQRALRRIDRIFGVDPDDGEQISLRLIEVMSFLQSRLKGGWLVVSSGYRSPAYNRMLRDKGRTVAKASLHQYGMAADLRIEGWTAKRLWLQARKHKVGGAGYYGGRWIHIDVGKVRFWTQGTANVRKGLSEHNKRIMLVPRYDVFAAGETVRLRFARMTAYPIEVKREMILQRLDERLDAWQDARTAAAVMRGGRGGGQQCRRFAAIDQMRDVGWALPGDLKPGRYRLRAAFCGVKWPAMPATVSSSEFVVKRRAGSRRR